MWKQITEMAFWIKWVTEKEWEYLEKYLWSLKEGVYRQLKKISLKLKIKEMFLGDCCRKVSVLYNNATNNAVLNSDIEMLYIGKSNSFAYANVTCILCHLFSSFQFYTSWNNEISAVLTYVSNLSLGAGACVRKSKIGNSSDQNK